MSKLCDAIKNLPSRFLSEELVMEAAKEHEPKLLGYLPEEFITPEVVEEVFGGGLNAYYWNCDLSRVPVECRTRDVCMKALRCSSENMFHVPSHLIDDQIVEVVLQSSKKLQYFHLLPSHLWTKGFIYRAMKSLGANHSNSSYSSGNVKSDVIRRCRILLSLAPDSIKTGSFYHGLFEEKMASAVISALTPVKYRNKQYRRLMAHYDIDCVPVKELTYELVVIALGKGAGVSSNGLFKPTERREHIFEMMDNRLADTIVATYPTFFNELPEQFQTSTRLQLAVKSAGENEENRYYHLRHSEELLTPNVVREFVKQGIECKIPATFWDEEFSWFCAQHTRSFFWFEQMPRELQTKEMVSAAIRRCHSNLRYASKDKITENVACEVVRGVVNAPSYSSTRENMEYLPEKYFAKFTKKTGLPEKFMGGEVEFKAFKEDRKHFTYCRIGNVYAGVYAEGYRGSEEHNLILTRVIKGEAPKKLYEGRIGAFHKTWIEKPVAEYDGGFVKPKVDSSLRDVQAVSYYGVEHLEQRDGFDIYANTFCGITVGYCVKKDGLTYHDDSIEAALTGWQTKVEQAKLAEEEKNNPDSAKPDPDSVVFTAEMLHRKYSFCEAGMTAFVNDYGLDYNGRYSAGYLRQVVAIQGPKPSLRSYGRELRQIGVIQ